jgi:hypothetical protein
MRSHQASNCSPYSGRSVSFRTAASLAGKGPVLVAGREGVWRESHLSIRGSILYTQREVICPSCKQIFLLGPPQRCALPRLRRRRGTHAISNLTGADFGRDQQAPRAEIHSEADLSTGRAALRCRELAGMEWVNLAEAKEPGGRPHPGPIPLRLRPPSPSSPSPFAIALSGMFQVWFLGIHLGHNRGGEGVLRESHLSYREQQATFGGRNCVPVNKYSARGENVQLSSKLFCAHGRGGQFWGRNRPRAPNRRTTNAGRWRDLRVRDPPRG